MKITENWPIRSQMEQQQFGGGGNQGAQQIANAPAAAAVPPVTSTSADVVQAQQDMRRQSLRKRGFVASTMFAGDTNGWNPPSSPTGQSPKITPPTGGGATTLGGG